MPGVPTVPSALTVPRVPTVPTALTAPIAPIATTATTASTPSRGSTLLVRIPNGQLRRSHARKSYCRSQAVEIKLPKSTCRSLAERVKHLSQAVEVYSFGHSVDSVDSIQSKPDLINRYVYYNTKGFIYQIVSQNLSKIKAILIFSDVTKVCDYTKLLENI